MMAGGSTWFLLISCCIVGRSAEGFASTPLRGSSGRHVASIQYASHKSYTTNKGFGPRKRRRRTGTNEVKGAGRAAVPPVIILKRSNKWACIKGCGACCYLAPEERPDLEDYLRDEEELALYHSMAQEDGWCKHFDRNSRSCTIYEDRPRFCRVEAETFGDMYGVDPLEMDSFCSSCCRENIGDVHGISSPEMKAFNSVIASLERGERPIPEYLPFGQQPGTVISSGDTAAVGDGRKQIRGRDIPSDVEGGI
ncbi:unnamed protein product [Choristocarpus tenellus]